MPSHITSSMADATASDEEDQQVEDARSGDMYPLLSQTATAPDHGLRKASGDRCLPPNILMAYAVWLPSWCFRNTSFLGSRK